MNSKRNTFDHNYLYKHTNNSDIAFQVITLGFTEYSQVISVRWFNIVNPDKIELIDSQDNITVPDELSHNWIRFAFLTEHNEWKVVYREATLS